MLNRPSWPANPHSPARHNTDSARLTPDISQLARWYERCWAGPNFLDSQFNPISPWKDQPSAAQEENSAQPTNRPRLAQLAGLRTKWMAHVGCPISNRCFLLHSPKIVAVSYYSPILTVVLVPAFYLFY